MLRQGFSNQLSEIRLAFFVPHHYMLEAPAVSFAHRIYITRS